MNANIALHWKLSIALGALAQVLLTSAIAQSPTSNLIGSPTLPSRTRTIVSSLGWTSSISRFSKAPFAAHFALLKRR